MGPVYRRARVVTTPNSGVYCISLKFGQEKPGTTALPPASEVADTFAQRLNLTPERSWPLSSKGHVGPASKALIAAATNIQFGSSFAYGLRAQSAAVDNPENNSIHMASARGAAVISDQILVSHATYALGKLAWRVFFGTGGLPMCVRCHMSERTIRARADKLNLRKSGKRC
jgi:hypothetical protein